MPLVVDDDDDDDPPLLLISPFLMMFLPNSKVLNPNLTPPVSVSVFVSVVSFKV